MKKNGIKYSLLLIIGLMNSCYSTNKDYIYYFNSKFQKIQLLHNYTFNIESQKSIPYGTWSKKGRKVFLTSVYDPDSIKNVKISYSNSDTSQYCGFTLKNFSNITPFSAFLLLKSHSAKDTMLSFVTSLSEICYVKKIKGFDSFQVIEGVGSGVIEGAGLEKIKTGKSKLYPFKISDTVAIKIDYPASLNYSFYKNAEFIIKRKMLVPNLDSLK